MKAGFAKQCITPPLGVELCGYGYYLNRRCTAVQDDLFVRCLSLEDGGTRYLIFSADLIGLSPDIAQEIRSLLAQRCGMDPDAMMLHCIHTHTGPATAWLEGCGAIDEPYLSTLPERYVAAATEALQDLTQVVDLYHCHTNIRPIGFNRAAADGPVDPAVRGLKFIRKEKPPIALISHACHAVARGLRSDVSADYPGEVCRRAESEGDKAIFINGICGDIDPDTQIRRLDFAQRDQSILEYAQRIYRGFEQGLKPMEAGGIRFTRFELSIPLERMTREKLDEIAQSKAGCASVGEIWKNLMCARLPLPEEETCVVSAMRIGKMVLCALPYEAFTFVGMLIRQMAPQWDIAVAGCCDGLLGYLPTSDQHLTQAYAYLGSAWLYLRPLFADTAAEAAGKGIGKRLAAVLAD